MAAAMKSRHRLLWPSSTEADRQERLDTLREQPGSIELGEWFVMPTGGLPAMWLVCHAHASTPDKLMGHYTTALDAMVAIANYERAQA